MRKRMNIFMVCIVLSFISSHQSIQGMGRARVYTQARENLLPLSVLTALVTTISIILYQDYYSAPLVELRETYKTTMNYSKQFDKFPSGTDLKYIIRSTYKGQPFPYITCVNTLQTHYDALMGKVLLASNRGLMGGIFCDISRYLLSRIDFLMSRIKQFPEYAAEYAAEQALLRQLTSVQQAASSVTALAFAQSVRVDANTQQINTLQQRIQVLEHNNEEIIASLHQKIIRLRQHVQQPPFNIDAMEQPGGKEVSQWYNALKEAIENMTREVELERASGSSS